MSRRMLVVLSMDIPGKGEVRDYLPRESLPGKIDDGADVAAYIYSALAATDEPSNPDILLVTEI